MPARARESRRRGSERPRSGGEERRSIAAGLGGGLSAATSDRSHVGALPGRSASSFKYSGLHQVYSSRARATRCVQVRGRRSRKKRERRKTTRMMVKVFVLQQSLLTNRFATVPRGRGRGSRRGLCAACATGRPSRVRRKPSRARRSATTPSLRLRRFRASRRAPWSCVSRSGGCLPR